MLGELGYGWAYRVLDAQYHGVAQRRRRVFVVGCLGNWQHAAAVLFERHSLSGNPAPSREARKSFAPSTSFCFEPRSPDGYARVVGDISPTLNRMGGGQREPCVAQPISYSMITANTGSNGLGVSVEIAPTLDRAQPAAVAHLNSMIAEPLFCHLGTINNQAVEANHVIPIPTTIPISTQNASSSISQPIGFNARQDPCSWIENVGTLDTDASTQAVLQLVSIPISTQNALGRVNGIDEWPLGIFNDGDPAPTLSKSHGHAVATNITNEFVVRRLTPVECERLQGFPDNYTNIPGAADGPRYKALGNSMAVPVMNWIGKRIQQVEDIVNKNEVA
jgi:DNA (cytosine-5)-methyltransferase 1